MILPAMILLNQHFAKLGWQSRGTDEVTATGWLPFKSSQFEELASPDAFVGAIDTAVARR